MDKGKRPMDPYEALMDEKMRKKASTSQHRLWLQPPTSVTPHTHARTTQPQPRMTLSPITPTHMPRTPATSSVAHQLTNISQPNVQQLSPSLTTLPTEMVHTYDSSFFPTPSQPFLPPRTMTAPSCLTRQMTESSQHNLSLCQIAQRSRRARERVPNNQVLSNRALAQRARRARERQQQSNFEVPSSILTPSSNIELFASTTLSTGFALSSSEVSTSTVAPSSNVASSLNVASFLDVATSMRVHIPPEHLTRDNGNIYISDEDGNSDIDDDIPATYVPNVFFQLRRTNVPNVDHTMQAQGRHFLGKMNIECPFCKALHWIDERLKSSPVRQPKFGTCCLQGQIRLPVLPELPPPLRSLYDGNDRQSKSFRRHMREYNSAFAFTSLGVKMDERVLGGRGPKSFTIQGELRHRTGSLVPAEGRDASYSQLYIYDPSFALGVRQRRNPQLDEDVLRTIQEVMLQYNRFSKDFQHAHEILMAEAAGNEENFNIPVYLHYSSKKDKRRYNLPSADEVAVILPGNGNQGSSTRDIVLHLRANNALMQISECHPAYLPLHYVLMFPHGELGWTPELRRWDTTIGTTNDDRLTQLDFYSYLLFERRSEYSPILRGKRLFQEFLVDGWAATEQNKLGFVRNDQPRFRSELYQKVVDVTAECISPDQVGKRIILPASHIGTPRHMFEILQDSLAITRFNKHPDIFLTMTANPNWPEIIDALLPYQNPTDRPDLVARVFELKRRALMKYIKESWLFGKIVGHVYTIKFQKRGLPHMHVLFYLQHSDKISTIPQVYRIVCAEFPDPDEEPELFQTVITCMIHGPCGVRNKHAACMENNICTKGYPKRINPGTTMDKDGYPLYCRRDNGRTYYVRGIPVDNRDVVPYDPKLSKMFNCHINVEVCAGFRCVKYIHKYIFKGYDMATMVLNGIDEIQQYLDARYIGPPEAAWHLFGYRMHDE